MYIHHAPANTPRLPQSLVRFVIGRVFSVRYRLHVTGMDHIPRSGAVLAWVGSRDYATDPFDHVQAEQVGVRVEQARQDRLPAAVDHLRAVERRLLIAQQQVVQGDIW